MNLKKIDKTKIKSSIEAYESRLFRHINGFDVTAEKIRFKKEKDKVFVHCKLTLKWLEEGHTEIFEDVKYDLDKFVTK